MYVLIDLDEMVFRHVHPSRDVINGLAHIELSHSSTAVCDTDGMSCFAGFTDLELKLLCRNSTGEVVASASRTHLLQIVRAIALALPVTEADPMEVWHQARGISKTDAGFYRYVKGARKAAQLQELFVPTPLVTTMREVSSLMRAAEKLQPPNDRNIIGSALRELNPSTFEGNIMTEKTEEQLAVEAAQKEAKAAAAAEVKAAKQAEREAAKQAKLDAKEAAKAEREAAKAAKEQAKLDAKAAKEANRPPEQNGVRRPGPNGACGRVWALADSMSAELGQPVAIAELLNAAIAEGLNPSNTRTEYARWKKFHGISSRVADSAAAA